MKQIPIKLGPLTLLLTVITICMAVLAVLTFTTARADGRLAEKYAQTVKVRYELEARGQEYLSEIAAGAARAEDRTQDGLISRTFEEQDSYLTITVDDSSGAPEVVSWEHGRYWAEETGINVWDGN